MHLHGRRWPKFMPFDGDLTKWTKIEYSEYWDFARSFVCEHRGRKFLFEAPFLELDDEYSDYFIVRELPKEGSVDGEPADKVGQILPVDELTMDESRREYVLTDVLNRFEL